MLIFNDSTRTRLADNIKANRNMYIFNGVLFMGLGIIALIAPLAAAEFLFMLIGCLLVIAGVLQASFNFATKRHWSFYITAAIAIIAGILLVVRPEAGIYFFGMIIAVFLLLQGFMQLFYAGVYAPYRGWGWMLASGLLSIALAIFIFVGWPLSASWLFGVLIAINLMLFGFSLLTIAMYLDNLR